MESVGLAGFERYYPHQLSGGMAQRVALIGAPEVLLPAALPSLLTGLRLGLAQGWLFLVAAELIAASRGLGFLLVDSQNTGRTDVILLAIVLLALLERRLLRWNDTYKA